MYDSEELKERLLAVVRLGRKVGTYQEFVKPALVHDELGQVHQDTLNQITALVTTSHGTLHRLRVGMQEHLDPEGTDQYGIVSERTVLRNVQPFGRDETWEDHPLPGVRKHRLQIDYVPELMHEWSDAALLAAFLAAVMIGGLSHLDYYITIDGTDRPFYGKTYKRRKGEMEYTEEELTPAGRNTDPAYQGSKNARRGRPTYRGTVSKHSYLQVTCHVFQTMESFPIGIRRGKVTRKAIDELVQLFECLPIKPAFIFADKEFCSDKKGGSLRAWCDKHEVVLCMAHPKNKAEARVVKHDWNKHLVQLMEKAPEAMYWNVRRHYWKNKPKSTPQYSLLTIYMRRDPCKDKTQDFDGLMRLPKGVFAFSFYVNVEVTPENVYWLSEQYSQRWACENLHKRWKDYCGRSGSHGMFARDFLYHAAMMAFSAVGLWRLERRIRLGLEVHDDRLSTSRWFGDVRLTCEKALMASAKLE